MAKNSQLTLPPGARITVIDPGETTGVCQMRYLGKRDFEVLFIDQIPWNRRFRMREFIQGVHHIVIERFALYASHSKDMINNEFPSVRIIGICEAYMNEFDMLDAVTYQPASVMTNVAILPQHAEYVKGSEHKKDAYRHGRYFILMHRDRSEE
jgi:hypothetical protein